MSLVKKSIGSFILVSISLVLTLEVSLTAIFADQKELMDEWVKHKRQIAEKVVNKLRQEGKLPQYGTIEFTARVKPLPSGDLEIIVDKFKVSQRDEKKLHNVGSTVSHAKMVKTTQDEEVARKFQEIFRPRNPAPYWTTGTIDIVGGTATSADISIKKPEEGPEFTGKPEESVPSSVIQPSDTSNSKEGSEVSSDKSEPRIENKQENMGWWDKFWRWLTGKSEGGQ